MPEFDIVVEDNGAPALLLAGASVIAPNTKSGNPAHEVRTGRFGWGGKGKPPPGQQLPSRAPVTAPVDTASRPDLERRRDAVVDAARTISTLTPQSVSEFMRQRWQGTRVLTEEDAQQFLTDVQRQRIEDIIDTLDARLRRAKLGRGAKVVKVDFPRGVVKATLNNADNETVVKVLQRLRFRGWTANEIRRHVVKTFDDSSKRMAAELGALQ